MVGGTLIFSFSFAPFVAYDERLVEAMAEGRAEFPESFSAWSTETFMAPITWWAIVAGALLAALGILRFATGRDVSLAGFRATPLQLALALYAFLLLLGYSVADKQQTFGYDPRGEFVDFPLDPHFAWGGVLMLIGAAIGLIGAVLNHILRPATARDAR